MRILQVSHYTLPHYGGIETVVEHLSRELVRQGQSVKVLSCRTTEASYEQRHGVEFVRVPAWNGLERYAVPYPLFSPSLLPTAYRLVKWCDVVHAHGFLYQSTLVALWFARLLNRPAVLTEHAGYVRYNRRAWNAVQSVALHTLGRLALALANAVVVAGERAAAVVRRLVAPQKPVYLIPVGIDTTRFRPSEEDEKARLRRLLGWDDRPRILSVGRLVPRKGIEWLLQAADPRYEIVVCGRGEMVVPSQDGVRLYRSPDDETLLAIYRAADIYVLPSHSEGAFPLAAQQAMACGLPVVAVKDPVYESYVNEQVVQFVDPTPNSLREALLYLAEYPEERRLRGARAAQWAHTHFSHMVYTMRCLELYRTLLGEEAHA